MNLESDYYIILRNLVAGSIFFVWIIRYQNIVDEFKEYNYPNSLRDFVGVMKLSFALMLLSSSGNVVVFGSIGIATLMLAAFITHLKVRNPVIKMMPSFSLFCLCLIIIKGGMNG